MEELNTINGEAVAEPKGMNEKAITIEEYKVIANVCKRLGVEHILTCGGDSVYNFTNQSGELIKAMPTLINLSFSHLGKWEAERITKALGNVADMMYQIQLMERELLGIDNFLGYLQDANDGACKIEETEAKNVCQRLEEEKALCDDVKRKSEEHLFISNITSIAMDYKLGMIEADAMADKVLEAAKTRNMELSECE